IGVALAYAFIYQGCRLFTGRPSDWRLPLAVITASILPLFWLLDLHGDFVARVMVTASGLAVLNFAGAVVMLKGAARDDLFRRLLGSVLFANAIMLVVRNLWSGLAPAHAGSATAFLLT